jgi:acetate kinase
MGRNLLSRTSRPSQNSAWKTHAAPPGLLGISGVGSGRRHLHEADASYAGARLAIQMFCCSVRKQVAAMIAALDGVDMLVFTDGMGENDGEMRGAICGGLSWIGVSLDEERSRSASNSLVALLGARAPLAGRPADSSP